jgi:transposase-like protein
VLKTLRTCFGCSDFHFPQTLGYRDAKGRPFYPQSLERAVRSERMMTVAVVNMYCQGVNNRKVTAVAQELCSLDINSSPG